MPTCDICGSTNNVRAIKIGDLICEECVKPMRAVHDVFGGKVQKVKPKE